MNKRNFLKSIPFLGAALAYIQKPISPITVFGKPINDLKTQELGPIFMVEYPCVFLWKAGEVVYHKNGKWTTPDGKEIKNPRFVG